MKDNEIVKQAALAIGINVVLSVVGILLVNWILS